MTSALFKLFVMYGQLSVFLPALEQPFNDWQQKHIDQGFSWREGSVSFETLEESGQHSIELEVSNQPKAIDDEAVRVIEVPFEVTGEGDVEVASISESVALILPVDTYI